MRLNEILDYLQDPGISGPLLVWLTQLLLSRRDLWPKGQTREEYRAEELALRLLHFPTVRQLVRAKDEEGLWRFIANELPVRVPYKHQHRFASLNDPEIGAAVKDALWKWRDEGAIGEREITEGKKFGRKPKHAPRTPEHLRHVAAGRKAGAHHSEKHDYKRAKEKQKLHKQLQGDE